MLGGIVEKAGLNIAKSALYAKDEELSTVKRAISVLAGAYLLNRGVRTLFKKPFVALQEVGLGGFLVYTGVTGKSPLGKEVKENQKFLARSNDKITVDPDSYYRRKLNV